MLTRNIYNNLLNIQYTKGYFTFDDLPNHIKTTINDKYKNKKLCLNRKDLNIYYIGRISSGLTANILCKN